MKHLKILLTIALGVLSTITIVLHAQVKKSDKQIIIIERTVDEKGNELSKKIIRKNSDDLSDEELEKLLKEDDLPFGKWDMSTLKTSPFGQHWYQPNGDSKPTLGLSLSFENNRVNIVTVAPSSGANDADIRAGDELIAIEGSSVSSYEDIQAILSNKKEGDEVRVKIYRDGQEYEKFVTLKSNQLGNMPFKFPDQFGNNGFFFDLGESGGMLKADSLFRLFGGGMGAMDSIFRNFGFDNFTYPAPNDKSIFPKSPSEKASLGVFIDDDINGVVVSEVMKGSAADRAGIQKGDAILRLNDEMITSYRELSMLMNKQTKGEKINLQIERKGKKQLVEVELD